MSPLLLVALILVFILLVAYFAYNQGKRQAPKPPPKPLPPTSNASQIRQSPINKPVSSPVPQQRRGVPAAPVPIQRDDRTEQLERSLRKKCFGDKAKAERLIQYEATRAPNASRATWIQSAIERWERDNR